MSFDRWGKLKYEEGLAAAGYRKEGVLGVVRMETRKREKISYQSLYYPCHLELVLA